MIHVFQDGRLIYRDELLRESDEGKFISVEELPVVEHGENQQIFYFADLEQGVVKYRLIDLPEDYGDYGDYGEEEEETPED